MWASLLTVNTARRNTAVSNRPAVCNTVTVNTAVFSYSGIIPGIRKCRIIGWQLLLLDDLQRICYSVVVCGPPIRRVSGFWVIIYRFIWSRDSQCVASLRADELRASAVMLFVSLLRYFV